MRCSEVSLLVFAIMQTRDHPWSMEKSSNCYLDRTFEGDCLGNFVNSSWMQEVKSHLSWAFWFKKVGPYHWSPKTLITVVNIIKPSIEGSPPISEKWLVMVQGCHMSVHLSCFNPTWTQHVCCSTKFTSLPMFDIDIFILISHVCRVNNINIVWRNPIHRWDMELMNWLYTTQFATHPPVARDYHFTVTGLWIPGVEWGFP